MELKQAWVAHLKLWAEGDKLCAEGGELYDEGDKLRDASSNLYAEGIKLKAHGKNLFAEGTKLRAESDILWAGAILATHGNIALEWRNRDGGYDCYLPNGEVFRWNDTESTC